MDPPNMPISRLPIGSVQTVFQAIDGKAYANEEEARIALTLEAIRLKHGLSLELLADADPDLLTLLGQVLAARPAAVPFQERMAQAQADVIKLISEDQEARRKAKQDLLRKPSPSDHLPMGKLTPPNQGYQINNLEKDPNK